MARVPSRPFLWRPGESDDGAALARLRAAFPRPREPMGEAWFLSEERHLYRNLMGDLDQVDADEFCDALVETALGPSCFGPHAEWTDWYHYLLPRVLPRAHESIAFDDLLETLVTAFMAQHPDGVIAPRYPGFVRDVLDTLGSCPMDRVCWSDEGLDVALCLNKSRNVHGLFDWADASGTLSCSLFLCLKYLPPEAVPAWLRSVLSIDDPHWRAQATAWMVGVHGMLTGAITQPAEFEGRSPEVTWEWSHCLKGNYTGDHARTARSTFLPEPNRVAAYATIREVMTEDAILAWIDSIAAYPDLAMEIADLPLEIGALYR